MVIRRTLQAFSILTATAIPGLAQSTMEHMNHNSPAMSSDWTEMMQRMHRDMDIAPTGDPDADFLIAMIPHHQGAIDMARYVLDHGKDPEVRALAEQIIVAQTDEIAWMRAWLANNGK